MPEKKKIKDKSFYINEIEVEKWLMETSTEDTFQKQRFSNRFEYKKNYKLHREDGPAIEYFDNSVGFFYVNGEKYSEEEFTNYKRSKILNRMVG